MLGSDRGIWSKLTIWAVICKPSHTGRHRQHARRWIIQTGKGASNATKFPTLLRGGMIFVFPGAHCLDSRVFCIKHLKLEKCSQEREAGEKFMRVCNCENPSRRADIELHVRAGLVQITEVVLCYQGHDLQAQHSRTLGWRKLTFVVCKT